MKKLLFILLLAISIILLIGCEKTPEKDIDWRTVLEDFLTQYPTLLDDNGQLKELDIYIQDFLVHLKYKLLLFC